MEQNRLYRKQIAQKKYRRSQANKGLTRFELQVSTQAKQRFDVLVDAAAEEYTHPWNKRQRIAKARAQVFEEMMQDVAHEFFTLKDQIQALKAEIKALSPQFFKINDNNSTPLPEAIRALPDDPQQLKPLLAQAHQEAQYAKRHALKFQRLAEQYEALYETVSNYNEELKQQLNIKN